MKLMFFNPKNICISSNKIVYSQSGNKIYHNLPNSITFKLAIPLTHDLVSSLNIYINNRQCNTNLI